MTNDEIIESFNKAESISNLRKSKSSTSILGDIDPTKSPSSPGLAKMTEAMINKVFTEDKIKSLFEVDSSFYEMIRGKK